MFKSTLLTINMTEPICACSQEDFSFSWGVDNKMFYVACKNCKVRVMMPWDEALANIATDVPRPKKKQEPPKQPRLTPIEGGKVLPMKPTGGDA